MDLGERGLFLLLLCVGTAEYYLTYTSLILPRATNLIRLLWLSTNLLLIFILIFLTLLFIWLFAIWFPTYLYSFIIPILHLFFIFLTFPVLYSSSSSRINRLTKFSIWLLIEFIFYSSIHWRWLNELMNRIKLEIIKSKITSCGILKYEIRIIKFVPGIICSFLIHNLFILIWQIDLATLMIWWLHHALIWFP